MDQDVELQILALQKRIEDLEKNREGPHSKKRRSKKSEALGKEIVSLNNRVIDLEAQGAAYRYIFLRLLFLASVMQDDRMAFHRMLYDAVHSHISAGEASLAEFPGFVERVRSICDQLFMIAGEDLDKLTRSLEE